MQIGQSRSYVHSARKKSRNQPQSRELIPWFFLEWESIPTVILRSTSHSGLTIENRASGSEGQMSPKTHFFLWKTRDGLINGRLERYDLPRRGVGSDEKPAGALFRGGWHGWKSPFAETAVRTSWRFERECQNLQPEPIARLVAHTQARASWLTHERILYGP